MLYRPSVYCRRPFKIDAASLSIASSEATQQNAGLQTLQMFRIKHFLLFNICNGPRIELDVK